MIASVAGRDPLSNFELMVLLALIRCSADGDGNAHGVPIAQAIEESTGTDVVGSVYSALERLEVKGW